MSLLILRGEQRSQPAVHREKKSVGKTEQPAGWSPPLHQHTKQKAKDKNAEIQKGKYIKKEMIKGGSEDGRGSKIHFGHD